MARAGDVVVPFIVRVTACVDAAMGNDSRAVRKEGGRVLRELLRGLTQLYAVDKRSLSPSEWDRCGLVRGGSGWSRWCGTVGVPVCVWSA